jgi:hypothetical protein
VFPRVWRGKQKQGYKIGGIMPFCSKCGTEVLEDVKFCSKCGASQDTENIKVSNNIHVQRLDIIISCVFGMLAVFMPWVNITGTTLIGKETLTLNGISDGSGWVTFGFFIIPFLIAILGDRKKPLFNSWVAWAGFLNMTTGIAYFFFLEDLVTTSGFITKKLSVGIGIYILTISGANILLTSIGRIASKIFKKLDDNLVKLDDKLTKIETEQQEKKQSWLLK